MAVVVAYPRHDQHCRRGHTMPIGRGNSDGTGLAMVEIVVVAVASRLPALSGVLTTIILVIPTGSGI